MQALSQSAPIPPLHPPAPPTSVPSGADSPRPPIPLDAPTSAAGRSSDAAAAGEDRNSEESASRARVLKIGPDMVLRGAERLAGSEAGPREVAARRFVEAAEKLGIDLSNFWGMLDPSGEYFREVCLAVVGAGRTAM